MKRVRRINYSFIIMVKTGRDIDISQKCDQVYNTYMKILRTFDSSGEDMSLQKKQRMA